jgi:Ricin-type beta-trefoil lectin domain.
MIKDVFSIQLKRGLAVVILLALYITLLPQLPNSRNGIIEAEAAVPQYIENGVYTISPKCASDKVVDIAGGSTADGANVQLYDSNSSNAQKYMLQYTGNGYYIIRNVGSNKVLDVCGGNSASGTKVQQYTYNGTDAQLWRVVPAGDGYYSLATKLKENQYLDVNGAGTSNGTSIQIYTANSTDAQKWKFAATACIADGTYSISPKCAQNSCLDVAGGSTADGTNIQIYSANGTKAQQFLIKYLGNNCYSMTCVNSGKVVDVAGGNASSGNNVWQYSSNGTDAQKWIIAYSGDENYFYILTKLNMSMCMDVDGGSSADGANVQIYAVNYTNAQKWRFTLASQVASSSNGSGSNNSGSNNSGTADRFAALKAKYPDKSIWNAGYYVNNVWKAGQCLGFACQIGYELTGIDPYGKWNKQYNLNSLKAGDIIYCNRPHAILVTNVSGDTITYADCNWYAKNTIKWDNTIRRSDITIKFGGLKYVLSCPQ